MEANRGGRKSLDLETHKADQQGCFLSLGWHSPSLACTVERRVFPAGASPAHELSFQTVAFVACSGDNNIASSTAEKPGYL